jgi:hypothetical protein
MDFGSDLMLTRSVPEVVRLGRARTDDPRALSEGGGDDCHYPVK